MKFATKALHAGHDPMAWSGASVMPITASVAYGSDSAEELEAIFAGEKKDEGHVYGRLSNPTVSTLERRWSALEEAHGTAAYATGMGAIAALFSALVEAGEEVIVSQSLFGGTRAYFTNMLSRNGVKIHYVDPDDLDALKKLLCAKTRLLFLEALGNPRMDVPDIDTWANIAQEAQIPLVLDNTLVTPALFKAKQHGVDITVQSGTKFLTGNGTVLSGSISDLGHYNWEKFPGAAIKKLVPKVGKEEAFLIFLRKIARQNLGAALSPFDAYLALLGADTLDLRMTRHSENVLLLAQYLAARSDLSAVSQIGLPSSPWHQRAVQYFGGRWGGLLTLRLGTAKRAFDFLRKLQLVKIQTNLGDARTLALHLASTIHREQSPLVRAEAGVSDDLVRISVGLEDPQDLIADFRSALDATPL